MHYILVTVKQNSEKLPLLLSLQIHPLMCFIFSFIKPTLSEFSLHM